MWESLVIKKIEVDDIGRIKSLEFDEHCFAKDIVEFCQKFGLIPFIDQSPDKPKQVNTEWLRNNSGMPIPLTNVTNAIGKQIETIDYGVDDNKPH